MTAITTDVNKTSDFEPSSDEKKNLAGKNENRQKLRVKAKVDVQNITIYHGDKAENNASLKKGDEAIVSHRVGAMNKDLFEILGPAPALEKPTSKAELNKFRERFEAKDKELAVVLDASIEEPKTDPLLAAINAAAPKMEAKVKAQEDLVLGIIDQQEEWQSLLAGVHHKVVGEDKLLKALILSGLSTSLPEGWQFSTFTNASSQMGKSFSASATAETLFSDFTMWQQSFSPLSFYYNAKENPYFMAGKLMVLDELADLSEESRNILKPIISFTHGELIHSTIDKQGKPMNLRIKAVPVIWANSAQLYEDYGLQLSNRFLKLGVDESHEQTEAINKARFHNAQLGKFRKRDKVLEAQLVIRKIMEFKPADVLIPTAPIIKVDSETRNLGDLFLSMVASCAYLHHFHRAVLDGGILIASTADIIEAGELWNSFASQRNAGAAGVYGKVLEALKAYQTSKLGEEATVDKLTDFYNQNKDNRPISAGRMNNILRLLSDRNLVSGKRPEGEHYYVYGLVQDEDEVLQITWDATKAEAAYNEWVQMMADDGVTLPDGIKEKVLDYTAPVEIPAELPKEEPEPAPQKGAATLRDLWDVLKGLINNKKNPVRMRDLERQPETELYVLAQKALRDGRIQEHPKTGCLVVLKE